MGDRPQDAVGAGRLTVAVRETENAKKGIPNFAKTRSGCGFDGAGQNVLSCKAGSDEVPRIKSRVWKEKDSVGWERKNICATTQDYPCWH